MAYILLNKKNLFHNLEVISKQSGSKEKVAIVLKDNAYGHGLVEMATLLKEFGIKKAVVRSLNEALKVEEYFEEILILAESNFPTYSHTFHIALNSMDNISHLPKNSKVHIKVDSGMHRNGIIENDLEACIKGLIEKGHQITGVFTHHRSADTLSSEFFWQNKNFTLIKSKVVNICEQLSIPLPKFHSCNSSALFRKKIFDEDMVRIGIATYGYLENDEIFDNPKLKPVLSLWANRISSRQLKKGEKLGYGGTFKAKEDLVISTYDVGYGDGFLRLNENQKYFTPNSYEILGRVSMDNISVKTKEQEICIFDDARDLARIHNTISYEIITTLSTQIPRIIK